MDPSTVLLPAIFAKKLAHHHAWSAASPRRSRGRSGGVCGRGLATLYQDLDAIQRRRRALRRRQARDAVGGQIQSRSSIFVREALQIDELGHGGLERQGSEDDGEPVRSSERRRCSHSRVA